MYRILINGRWRTYGLALALALALALTIAVFFAPPSAAAGKGWFGMALSVDAEGGSLNPALKSVTVASVIPGSPAFLAGLRPGDVILAIGSTAIKGTKADLMKPALDKAVGESLRLTVQRGTAASYQVTMVATEKPAKL